MTDDIFDIDDEDFDELQADEIVQSWLEDFDRDVVISGLSVEVVAQRFKYSDSLLEHPSIPAEVKENARLPLMNGEMLRALEASPEREFLFAYQRAVALTVWTARYVVLAAHELLSSQSLERILEYSAKNNQIEQLLAYVKENAGKGA